MNRFFVSVVCFALCSNAAFAECLKPFLQEPGHDFVPKSGGIILPISSNFFAYDACPEDLGRMKCLARMVINSGDQPEVRFTLGYMPFAADLPAEGVSDQFETIAKSDGGARIVSSRLDAIESHVVRLDHAVGPDYTYLLSVEHPISENYPSIEALQSFLRRHVTVCSE